MIKKLLPKSLIGWIFFIIAGNWIVYFFMNAHSILDKLNKSVPAWIGMLIIGVIILFSLGGNRDNDIDDNEVFSELINDPAYSSLEGNIYHDLMEGTIK